jgi:chaperonin cofactor prefoldin
MTQSNDPTLSHEERRRAEDHSIRIALLEHGMEAIQEQLKGINANMSKLVWLVFTALIVAVLKLILIP